MIVSFKHAGLEAFHRRGSKAGIQAIHAPKLRILLTALSTATAPKDLNAPAWRLHPLKGENASYWALTVHANWRLTFRFVPEGVELLDYLDYH